MASGFSFNETREKVCRACDSPIYKKMNTCCESSFYRIGVLIAIYAPAVLVFFVVLFGGLGLGMFQAEFQNDLYFLWIEKGSRLLGERQYIQDHHAAGLSRTVLQVYTNPDYKTNVLDKAHLGTIYDLVLGSLKVNATDEDLGTVYWRDVCDRIPTPPDLYGLMRATGAKGLPCGKYGPLDCWQEGAYGSFGFDLPDGLLAFTAQFPAPANPPAAAQAGCCTGPIKILQNYPVVDPRGVFGTNFVACQTHCQKNKLCVAFQIDMANSANCTIFTPAPLYPATPFYTFQAASVRANVSAKDLTGSLTGCGWIPGTFNTVPFKQCFVKQAQLQNKYLYQQSWRNMTDPQILNVTGEGTVRACGDWSGTQLPEGFYFGGITRGPAPSPGAIAPVTKVPSAEIVIRIKSPPIFAKTKCVDKCVANKSCGVIMQTALYQLGSVCTAFYTVLPSDNATLVANHTAMSLTALAMLNPGIVWNMLTAGQQICTAATQNLGVQGSCQKEIIDFVQSNCAINCTSNNTYAMSLVQYNASVIAGQFGACAAGLGCYTPAASCNFAVNPLCGSCLPTNGPVYNPTYCNYCSIPCTSSVPLMSACLQLCGTSKAQTCIPKYLAISRDCEIGCQTACANPSDADLTIAENTILEWELNLINYMAANAANKTIPLTIDYFTERSTDDLVSAAGNADSKLIVWGYIAMVVFGCLTLVNIDCLQSRLMLGFGGMILVIFSIVASLGFSAIVGILFVPTIVQVLPFLALGLGTYDMFVMAFQFAYVPEKTVPAMLGELLKECGPRLLLTASTNIIVFGIGANIPLSAVNLFSGAMCIVIFFNFMILVFGFGALIAINAERMRRNKIDCLCCINSKYNAKSISTERQHQIGWCPTNFAKLMFTIPMQLLVFAASIVIFGVAMWGVGQVQIGLPLQDIVPADFYAYGFLKARNAFYPSGSSTVVTGYKAGVSYTIDHSDPKFLYDMLALEAKLSAVPGTDPTFPIWTVSWVDTFLFFCATNPVAQAIPCARPATAKDPVLVVQGVGPTGPVKINSTAMPMIPRPGAVFQNSLKAFLASSGIGSVQYLQIDLNYTILSSRIPFFQAKLETDQSIVDYILATRAVTDASPQPCFPAGQYYDLYEQYVRTRHYLGTNLGYTCIGVLLITALFLFHPGAVLIMFAMICLTLAEIYGFLPFFKLKLNGVSVVNMIMAIGVVVAPVAHITRVFMVTHGTNAHRAEHALAMMTFPMLFSTISTFVGEFPMEFARFPYFTLYFFYQYVIIGVITLINAFLPLPLILAYFGPPPILEEGPHHKEGTEKGTPYEKGALTEIPGLEDSTAPTSRT